MNTETLTILSHFALGVGLPWLSVGLLTYAGYKVVVWLSDNKHIDRGKGDETEHY